MKEKNQNNLKVKPPVVVLLGHVDHGKSSLLEAIKDFKITQKEKGGITQHIGAYTIEHQGKSITFIDTPGHEAFCAMRARGAKVADIGILVVAAEEGVKPQTKEAIECIKEAELPHVVALNKTDKPEANPQKTKNELGKNGINVEELGGDIPCVPTSATQKTGIAELLDMILLVAEVNQLKTDYDCPAEGAVIETSLDEKRGPMATLLVKKGVLKRNDIVATPSCLGKVRLLEDFQGTPLEEAGPSQPAAAMGFEDLPRVGEVFKTFSDIEKARQYVINKEQEKRIPDGESHGTTLNIVLKTDVLGSLEAIQQMIQALPQKDIKIKLIRVGVGHVGEDDIQFAYAGNAKIFSFRSEVTLPAKKLAENKKIEILQYEVIYEMMDKIQKLMKQQTQSETVRRDVGRLEVLRVFRTEKGKNKQIVGGRVLEGEAQKQAKLEVLRGEELMGGGKILDLQREKKPIERASTGDEIGILYQGNARIQEGDVIVFYVHEQKTAEL